MNFDKRVKVENRGFRSAKLKPREVPRGDLNKSHGKHQWGSNCIKKGPAKDPPGESCRTYRCPRKCRSARDHVKTEEAESTEGIPGSPTANISQEKEMIEPG